MSQNPTEHRSDFLRGLGVQLDVLGALITRELQLRFGRDNIGYLWLIGEPMLFATVISAIHTLYNSHSTADIKPFPFTLVGYTLFIILRAMVSRAESALDTGLSLLYHRMITIFDIMLSRAIVDAVGCFIAFLLLCALAIMTGYASVPARPLYVLMAFGWMFWFSFGLSLLVATAAFGKPLVGRLIAPLTYFMIPVSGAFWMVSWLPAQFKAIAIWVPMVTIFEHARYGMFRTAPDTYLYPGYITAVCCFLTYAGMINLIKVRDKVHLA